MESPTPPPVPGPAGSPPGLSAREQYNVVSDTVVGVNVRWRDNLVQLACILVATLAGIGIGRAWGDAEDRTGPMMLGALGGLVSGTLLSGAGLMVYRFVRHVRGRHD